MVVVLHLRSSMQGLLATNPRSNSRQDVVGECLRFVLFLDNLYGRMSNVAFLITLIDLYERIIYLVMEKATSLSLTPFPETYELRSYTFVEISCVIME